MSQEKVYSEDEINSYLSDKLPHWFYENGWIRRKYKTSGWKGTLMVVNTVGHLAEAAWHHPDIAASYGFAIVKLQNHAAKGITDKDFLLAFSMSILFDSNILEAFFSNFLIKFCNPLFFSSLVSSLLDSDAPLAFLPISVIILLIFISLILPDHPCE